MMEKVNNKLAGWKAKTLSQAGRLTFIKAIWQPLNMYNMSSDFIPKKYCNKMDAICTNFFWGLRRDKPAMHLLNRKHIFAPRDRGGLGLRHSRDVRHLLHQRNISFRIANDSLIQELQGLDSCMPRFVFSGYGPFSLAL
ncbi:putative ribonuclease H protein At1g65750 family [Senna tora]|uniref:Putative ribonuclease H protein At1g65750 family n=1 Tax=Senna tora TaxID=362788 RepID=A0A834T546_9FABA|nr:putative ribonuclease H protein At1g65750 family [Senna tora]